MFAALSCLQQRRHKQRSGAHTRNTGSAANGCTQPPTQHRQRRAKIQRQTVTRPCQRRPQSCAPSMHTVQRALAAAAPTSPIIQVSQGGCARLARPVWWCASGTRPSPLVCLATARTRHGCLLAAAEHGWPEARRQLGRNALRHAHRRACCEVDLRCVRQRSKVCVHTYTDVRGGVLRWWRAACS
jgi:hypothetical protein